MITTRVIRVTMADLSERLDAYLRNLSELLGLPQPAPQPAPQPMIPQPALELDTPPCPSAPAPVELEGTESAGAEGDGEQGEEANSWRDIEQLIEEEVRRDAGLLDDELPDLSWLSEMNEFGLRDDLDWGCENGLNVDAPHLLTGPCDAARPPMPVDSGASITGKLSIKIK